MNGKEQLAQFKISLDKELQKYFDTKISEAGKISPLAKELTEHIAELTLRGGKRIRAALLYYSYLAHGGRNRAEAMQAAMSMELSETYLLIHDDIIDNDILRRGGATIHESYRLIGDERYHNKADINHFGQSIAMLAGDIANGMSNEIIAERKFKRELTNRALLELNKIYITECYGQALDILSELRDDITKEDVILVHKLKTVPYTFDGPVKIGAILAGETNERKISSLENYTVPLGTAFQIQDDILGLFGTEEKLGKPVLSDLQEGKKTLLILSALEKANQEQRNTVLENLGNRNTDMSGLEAVRKVIEDTLSLEESKKIAGGLVEDALISLDNIKLKKEGKSFLAGIAEYMIQRNY